MAFEDQRRFRPKSALGKRANGNWCSTKYTSPNYYSSGSSRNEKCEWVEDSPLIHETTPHTSTTQLQSSIRQQLSHNIFSPKNGVTWSARKKSGGRKSMLGKRFTKYYANIQHKLNEHSENESDRLQLENQQPKLKHYNLRSNNIKPFYSSSPSTFSYVSGVQTPKPPKSPPHPFGSYSGNDSFFETGISNLKAWSVFKSGAVKATIKSPDVAQSTKSFASINHTQGEIKKNAIREPVKPVMNSSWRMLSTIKKIPEPIPPVFKTRGDSLAPLARKLYDDTPNIRIQETPMLDDTLGVKGLDNLEEENHSNDPNDNSKTINDCFKNGLDNSFSEGETFYNESECTILASGIKNKKNSVRSDESKELASENCFPNFNHLNSIKKLFSDYVLLNKECVIQREGLRRKEEQCEALLAQIEEAISEITINNRKASEFSTINVTTGSSLELRSSIKDSNNKENYPDERSLKTSINHADSAEKELKIELSKSFADVKNSCLYLQTPKQPSTKKKMFSSNCYTPNSLSICINEQMKDIYG